MKESTSDKQGTERVVPCMRWVGVEWLMNVSQDHRPSSGCVLCRAFPLA